MTRRWEGEPGASGTPDGGSPVSLTAEEAEDLLAGRPGPAGSEALAGLLATLAGPAQPRAEELTGYEAARQAFAAAGSRAPHKGAATQGGTRSASASRRVSGRGRIVRVGMVAAALSVAGVGGAAAANSLPTPLQRLAHDVFGGIGVPAPSDADASGTSVPSAGPTPSGAPGGSTGASSGPAGVSPSSNGVAPGTGTSAEAVALCRAYAQDGDTQGLTPAQRARLAELAGGKQHIAKYCKGVLAASSAAGATSASTGSAAGSATAANGNGNGGGNGNANGGGNGNAGGGGNSNATSGGNGNASRGGNGKATSGGNGNAGRGGNGKATGKTKP